MSERIDATRDGRWGIRQIHVRNGPTGGGTINCGWETREIAEAQNPPQGDYRYEAFVR